MADNDNRPAAVTAFRRALELAGEITPGLDVDDITLVESAWEIPDTVVSSHGWVLVLKDGRRLYLEYTLDDTKPGGAEEFQLVELRSGEAYPVLENDAGVFWHRPDSQNRALGFIDPSLH